MRTALSLLAPFLLLPTLLILGAALALAHVQRVGRSFGPPDGRRDLLLASVTGISLNFTLAMILMDLGPTLFATGLLTLCSLLWLVAVWRRRLSGSFAMPWPWALLAVSILLIYAGPVLLQPLEAWDARSIWFFHAKVIYFNASLNAGDDWANPAMGFSHLSYPKLLPLLAAQFASLIGYWNEYMPKAAMLVLLMPVALGISTLGKRFDLGFVYLLFTFLLNPGALLWNGYTDGYLAAYAGMALLFLARWLEAHDPVDCTVGVMFLGLAINLKNEGALLAVSIGGSLALYKLANRACWRISDLRQIDRSGWTLMSIPLLGFVVWVLRKKQWGLYNDLQLGSNSLTYLQRHLDEDGLSMVMQAMLVQGCLAAAAVLLLLAVWIALRLHLGPRVLSSIWFPSVVAVMYTCGMYVVYMVTPYDLGKHLSNSVDRTMLLVITGMFASTFLTLQRILAVRDTDKILSVESAR